MKQLWGAAAAAAGAKKASQEKEVKERRVPGTAQWPATRGKCGKMGYGATRTCANFDRRFLPAVYPTARSCMVLFHSL